MLLGDDILLMKLLTDFTIANWPFSFVQVSLVFGFSLFIIIIVMLIICLSFLLSPRFRFSSEKLSSYECGFEPFGDARLMFDIHFYIIGILFLIFDLELVFLFPWLFSYCNQTPMMFFGSLVGMFLFLFLLALGFVYEWYSGALVWAPVQKIE